MSEELKPGYTKSPVIKYNIIPRQEETKSFKIICGTSCPTSLTDGSNKAIDGFELQFKLLENTISVRPNQIQAADIRYLIRDTYNSLLPEYKLSPSENLNKLNYNVEREFTSDLSLILGIKELSSSLRYVRSMFESYLSDKEFLAWVIKSNLKTVDLIRCYPLTQEEAFKAVDPIKPGVDGVQLEINFGEKY